MALSLNRMNRTVISNGKEKHFTEKEFDILSFLVSHPDQIYTPEEIYESVWNEKPYKCRQIICVHICHIREKIEQNPSAPQLLSSFWKKGYRFNSCFA